MRTMIVIFIALLAIPFFQVAIDLRFDRPGAPVFINQSSRISTAFGKHLRTRDIPDRPKVRATAESELMLVEVCRANDLQRRSITRPQSPTKRIVLLKLWSFHENLDHRG
jgi:hypothetical protein